MGQGEYSLEIPVGKAWLSDREFLGFHNSLTDRFAPAPSGIYQYLKALEKKDSTLMPCPTVLLDEANLSPIEQYWSQFIVMADDESSRTLNLTNESVELPEHLKFIATTNHDMTTEPLSHRLIDRAPIIPMDIVSSEEEKVISRECKEIEVFSSEVYEKMFGVESIFNTQIDDTSERILISIIELLSNRDPKYGARFKVSPRKKSTVFKYFNTLKPLMALLLGKSEENVSNEALDFTVLYYLLPLISGTGSQLGTRLADLVVLLEQFGLEQCEAKVKDMIARAEYTLDTYSFFQY